MNRSLTHLVLAVLAAVLLVPAAARAQSLADAGDAASPDEDAAFDSGYGFAPVTPGPDAAAAATTDGCDDKLLNAPCTLLGAAGFCFPNGVDGSDSDLECVVDSDAGSSGCNVATDASSAGTLGGLAAFFGVALAAVSRRRRRR
jgi:MYXO-CTERM domain-containing protein